MPKTTIRPTEPRVEILTLLGVPAGRDTDAGNLDGAWVGAFAHSYFGPLVTTGYHVELGGERGSFRDRNGEGHLEVIAFDGRHVVILKRYPSGAAFRYRGELVGDTLSGFWESEGKLRTRGLFALRRSESLTESERSAVLRGGVRDRRAFFLFSVPMLAPIVLLLAFHEALGGFRYAVGFTVLAIVLAVLGHRVLPHNRLLERVRGGFPREVRRAAGAGPEASA